MEGAERRIPGEGLLKRMEERTRRRPRLGMTPAFYTRLGLEDPWAVPGEPEAAAPGPDGMVFLSAAPYYAMLKKLAAARKRRDRRLARYADARSGGGLRAVSRKWPGETAMPTPRIAALSLDSMQLPTAAPVAAAPVSTFGNVTEVPYVREAYVPAPRVSAWDTTPFVPARVVRGGTVSPAANAGARLARATAAAERTELTRSMSPQAVRAVARAERQIVEEGGSTEIVRVVRRTRLARPVVRVVEEYVASAAPAPAERAALRGTPRAANTTSRSPGSRSPSVQMATVAQAAEIDRAAAGALAAPERGEAMRPAATGRAPATQRAAARAERPRESSGGLSASPVSSARTTAGRPLAASPLARPAAPAAAAGPGPGSLPARRSAAAPARTVAVEAFEAAEPGVGAPIPARRVARLAASSAAVARAFSFAAAPAAAPASARSLRTSRLEVQASGAVVRHRAPAVASLANLALVAPIGAGVAPAEAAAPGPRAPTRGSVAAVPTSPSGVPSIPAPTVGSASPAAARPVAAPVLAGAPAARPGVVPVAGAPSQPSLPAAAVSLPTASARVLSGADRTPGEPLEAEAPAPRAEGSAARAARRASAPIGASSVPSPVAAEAGALPLPARSVRRAAAVRLESGAFVPAAQVPELLGPVVEAATPRATTDRLLDRSATEPVRARPAPAAAPERVLPVFGERSDAPVGAAAAPAARSILGESVAPARAALARVVVPEAGPAVGWAAARLADPAAPPSRSALRRVTPPSVVLAAPAAEAEPIQTEAPASQARRVSGARPAPARADAVVPVAQPVRAAARKRRAGQVAAAGERSEAAATVRRAERSEAGAAVAAPARGQVRRSGPLSWARTVAEAPLVGSFAAPTARRASSTLPSAAARGTGGSAASIAAVVARGASQRGPEAIFAQAPAAEALAELQAAGLVQSTWSPSTPVRTPSGTYVSARVAAAMPNLAVIPAITGPVGVSTAAPVPGARTPARSPEVRFVAGGSAAPTEVARPTDWMAARAGISRATGYRGAMNVAPVPATLAIPTIGEPAAQLGTGLGRATTGAPGTRGGPARTARTVEGGTFIGAPRVRGGATERLPGEAQTADVAEQAARRAPRARLETTLAEVSTEQLGAEAPTWAARSDGTPRVRSAQGLFDSLARATTAEQVVQVIAARAGELTGPVPMNEPMRAVVEQLRQELRSPAAGPEAELLRTRAPDVQAPEASVLRPRRAADPVASSALVRRGGTRPVRSSAIVKSSGGGDDRVSKLVKRLTDLIHLAENERRLSEAQRQVRMAEDTAAARAEGSAPIGASGSNTKLDIEVFSREVLEVVNRELEHRRERRTEDGDESGTW